MKKRECHLQAKGQLRLPVKQEVGLEQNLPYSNQKDQPCWHLNFRLLVSRSVRQQMSVVLGSPVCGALLWQPQETNEDHNRRENTLFWIFAVCRSLILSIMRKLIWSSYFEIRGSHLKSLKIDKKWFSTKNLGQVSEDQAAELKTVHFSTSFPLECAGFVTLLEVTRTILLSSCVSDLPHSPLLILYSGKCHCWRLQYLFVVFTVFYCFAFRDSAFCVCQFSLNFLKK